MLHTDGGFELLGLPRHCFQQCIRTQGVEVGTRVVERALFRNVSQSECRMQAELARQGLEDIQLGGVRIADAEIEHPVKPATISHLQAVLKSLLPAGTQQRRVEQIRAVGSPNHKYVRARLSAAQPIEFRQQLTHNAVHDTARVAVVPSLRCDRVELVEENHARPRVPCPLEHPPHVCL